MKGTLLLLTKTRCRRGFTLVEVLVAIAIGSALSLGILISTFQVVNVNASSNAHMQAVIQVQNAIHYLNRDVQMAQSIQPQGASGFPLVLTWTTWSNSDSNQVTYVLSGGNLMRQYSLNGGPSSNILVATDFSPSVSETCCAYDPGSHKLTATLTASTRSGSKQAKETRQIEIIPRPGS
jgi:prepilin-type N-terminal cleavage/methylation domain-containing protein